LIEGFTGAEAPFAGLLMSPEKRKAKYLAEIHHLEI